MKRVVKNAIYLGIMGFVGSLGACSNTDFGGKTGQRKSADANQPTPEILKATGGGFPEAPNINSPGWVGDKAKNDFVDLFNAGRGSGGDGDGPSGSGPNSSGPDGDSVPPGQKLLDDVDGVLWLPCDKAAATGGGVFPSQFYGKSDHKVRMSGEWCPKVATSSEATVLFVIDRSGSMTGGGGEGPNDPDKSGSCGRLKAAEIIVEKLSNAKNTKVRAGVVTFSSGAATRVPMGELANVESKLTRDVFCGSDPGIARTNYQAAFAEAKSQIEGEEGSKIVIFISDGSPTFYNGLNALAGITDDVRSRSETEGLKAAEALREIDGLTLYALFLGYNGSGAGTATDPKGYLENVAGGADNVRLTKDADGLVEAAANLGLPLSQVNIKNSKGSLVTINGTKDVAIEKVERHPTEEGRFIWYTEPFSFAGSAGKGELNTLTVTAETSSGDSLKTVSKVTYFLQP